MKEIRGRRDVMRGKEWSEAKKKEDGEKGVKVKERKAKREKEGKGKKEIIKMQKDAE